MTKRKIILDPFTIFRFNILMKLHNIVKKGNRYCGPSALSALTGLDTGRTAALLRKVGGRRSIRGTFHHEMLGALKLCGFNVSTLTSESDPKRRLTLAQWHRATERPSDVPVLLSVGHHYAIVQGRSYICGLTSVMVPLRRSPKWRARVRCAWQLTKVESVNLESVIPSTIRAPDPHRSVRHQAQRLAHKIGARIDAEDYATMDHIYVSPPDCLGEDHDPFEGAHIVFDWTEALDRVEEYAKLCNALST